MSRVLLTLAGVALVTAILLAGDAEEAADIAERYRRTRGHAALSDDVLLTALSYARRDRASGRIDAEDQAFIVDETAFVLLQRLLDPARWDFELASAELLSSEVVGLVAELPAARRASAA